MNILADDLTSALDALAPFAVRGWNTCVALNDRAVDSPIDGIAARDLDSRFLDPAAARALFMDAAEAASPGVLFKTVDSTLRGNIAAEIDGAVAGSGRRRAIVAPAFPAAGRATVSGRQLVGGVPVDRSVFGADPRTPVLTSLLDELLPRSCDCLVEARDATSDADLDAIVAAEPDPAAVLWIGSPGLAAALARRLAPLARGKSVAVPPAERVVVVVGSAHPASREQVARLVAAGTPVVEASGDEEAASAALIGALAGGVALLAAPAARTVNPDALVRALARIAGAARDRVDGVVVTGGDTARHVLLALGVERLALAGEIEPGVPFGLAQGRGQARAFVTKAGGFGDAATLAHCVDRLRGGAR